VDRSVEAEDEDEDEVELMKTATARRRRSTKLSCPQTLSLMISNRLQLSRFKLKRLSLTFFLKRPCFCSVLRRNGPPFLQDTHAER
jgi:hypothetical protein